jgi:hypothetical protein
MTHIDPDLADCESSSEVALFQAAGKASELKRALIATTFVGVALFGIRLCATAQSQVVASEDNTSDQTNVPRAPTVRVHAVRAVVQDSRTQIPDAAIVAAHRKSVHELYKDVYASRSAAALAELAAKLRHVAAEATDDGERYAMLSEAIDLAVNARDGAAALCAIDELAAQFCVNAGPLSVMKLRKVHNAAKSPEEFGTAASLWLQVADKALTAEDYESAQCATTYGCSAAREASDVRLLAQMSARAVDLRDLKEWRDSARIAERTLLENPTDLAANFALGRYRCLGRDDWANGRLNLISGNDARLKALAERDLANPTEPAAQVALADAWWDFGEDHADRTRVAARRRAAMWYSEALPHLAGLEAQRIQEALDEINAPPACEPESISAPSNHPITESTCLLRESFCLNGGNRVIKYKVTVPALARPAGTLRIVVNNMGDNSGDGAMYCELKDSKGARIFRQHGHRDGKYNHPAAKGSRWTLILEDLDTTGDGNKGSVEVWIDPG